VVREYETVVSEYEEEVLVTQEAFAYKQTQLDTVVCMCVYT
jgi:hypothetical protein